MEFSEFDETFVGKIVYVPTKEVGPNVGTVTSVAQVRATRYCFIDFGNESWLMERLDSIRVLSPKTAKILEGKRIHVQGQGPYAVMAVDIEVKHPRLECLKNGLPFVTTLDKVTRVDL